MTDNRVRLKFQRSDRIDAGRRSGNPGNRLFRIRAFFFMVSEIRLRDIGCGPVALDVTVLQPDGRPA